MNETRSDRKQQRDLAQARQAGTIAPATDHTTGQIINPHNPEFITKRPWYLQQQQQQQQFDTTTTTEPTLQHQTVQQYGKQQELSLTVADELLQQQQRQQQQQQQEFVKGQWVEALKKNKAPYQICQVIKVHSNNNNYNNTRMLLLDVQYEDGTIETKLKVDHHQTTGSTNPTTQRPRVRRTAMGNRYMMTSGTSTTTGSSTNTSNSTTTTTTGTMIPESSSSQSQSQLPYMESFVSKRDPYHGYDVQQHNTRLGHKYEQKNQLRRQIREQQQQQQLNNNKQQEAISDATAVAADKKSKASDNDPTNNASDASDDSDSDNDSDHDRNNNPDESDDDDDDDEFVQRDEDDVVLTTRLARQGGVGGAQMKVTARNLRIREDTAKYLYNLNVNSAYYDPKSRSMRDNPFGDHTTTTASATTEYVGDNFVRISGDAVALAQQQLFAWDDTTNKETNRNNNNADPSRLSSNNKSTLHPIANPSQMEQLQHTVRTQQETIRDTRKRQILQTYGGAEYLDGTDGLASSTTTTTTSTTTPTLTTTTDAVLPSSDQKLLRFGASTQVEEYTRDGRLVATTTSNTSTNANRKRQALESKYEENVLINGHTTVWGSFFHIGAFTWGYQDDHSLIKNSYCTGTNGRRANDEANAMQYGTGKAGSATLEQVRRHMLPPPPVMTMNKHAPPSNRSKLYGEIDPTIQFNEQKVQEAIQNNHKRLQQQQESTKATTTTTTSTLHDKKQRYNSNDVEEEMTPEMIEAYRIERMNTSHDPMAAYHTK